MALLLWKRGDERKSQGQAKDKPRNSPLDFSYVYKLGSVAFNHEKWVHFEKNFASQKYCLS